jgi:polysaccharide biosynthesis transport protein
MGGGTSGGTPNIDLMRVLRKYKALLIGTAIFGIVLGTAAHFLLARFYPIWSATMIYETYPLSQGLQNDQMNTPQREEMEQFMATQVLAVKSERIIQETSRNPRLQFEAPDWYQKHVKNGTYQADLSAENIADNLSAGVMGDSSLFRVSFWWTDPKDAAGLLGVLHESYSNYVQLNMRENSGERRASLNKAIAEFEQSIQLLQARRSDLIITEDVTSIMQMQDAVNNELRDRGEKIASAQTELEQIRSQLERMNDQMNAPNPIVADDDLRDEVEREQSIQWQKQLLNQLEGEYNSMLMRGLPPTHRQVERVRSLADAAKDQLEKQRQEMILKSFDARRNRLQNAVASLEASIAKHMSLMEQLKTKASELQKNQRLVNDIDEDLSGAREELTKLRSARSELDAMQSERKFQRVQQYDSPRVPTSVTFPKIYFLAPAGLMLSLGLVSSLIILRELMDQRIKGASDISSLGKTRVLGVVPDPAEDPAQPAKLETVFRDHPGGVMTEAFRQARGTILKQMQHHGRQSLLVVSGMPGPEGHAVASNLAFALAASEHKVLLIDANFRRPSVGKALGLPESPGLNDVLGGKVALGEAIHEIEDSSLSVLTAGQVSELRLERLSGDQMSKTLAEAKKHFEYIIVDVAPSVIAGDALAVANRCDSTLLVVKALSDKRGLVARLCNELAETKAEFLGVVVTGVRSAVGGYMAKNIAAHREYHNGHHKD